MTDPRTLAYQLVMDGEVIPLMAGMTIGRHIDNDLVVAGEDVLDFHLRLDVSPRGPVAVPLGDAILYLNDQLLELPAGLMPGDRLEVGQCVLVLEALLVDPPEAESWRLCPPGDAAGLPVLELLRIGRDPGSDLQLGDLHASRRHAELHNVEGSIWVRDLASANGTFINGERIRGARRVFHGDELRFDHFGCQLLGRGADLTPPRPATVRDLRPLLPAAAAEGRPDTGDTLEFPVVPRPRPEWPALPETAGPGRYLIPASGPTTAWHRLPMGRTLLGRHADCDLQLRDRTVSGQHTEILLRPEGATITDLMSTNGTLCNDRRVQSVRLEDGDRLQVGRVDLLYRVVAPEPAPLRWLPWVVAAAAAIAGAVLVLSL